MKVTIVHPSFVLPKHFSINNLLFFVIAESIVCSEESHDMSSEKNISMLKSNYNWSQNKVGLLQEPHRVSHYGNLIYVNLGHLITVEWETKVQILTNWKKTVKQATRLKSFWNSIKSYSEKIVLYSKQETGIYLSFSSHFKMLARLKYCLVCTIW